MPEVSVIVPVYNMEEYLPRCIESILAQTYRDFELILVDDGSSDNSGNMCDEYALKDNRIKSVHKENDGVSSARNCGLQVAEGKYILFIDSDDFVDPSYIGELLENKEYDYVTAGHYIQRYNMTWEENIFSILSLFL